MPCRVEVTFSPEEFRALRTRDLRDTTCVIFDVLRATSSFVTALANGADSVTAVEEISEAVALRKLRPDVLLAGERDGLRITAAQSGGVDFDLGNSPREFTREKVSGRSIVSTTTNGTRAIKSCAGARQIVIGSLLNLRATAEFVAAAKPSRVIAVAAGTFEEIALEDVLAAGAFCGLLRDALPSTQLADSAKIAAAAFEAGGAEFAQSARASRNAQRLLTIPDLAADVDFCLRQDALPLVAVQSADGALRMIR